MDKENLRKADLFTSLLVIIFGAWVCSEALSMPMTDSYGGVQNVWYVSPALFPLFVGSSILLLGLMLLRVATKALGFADSLKAIQNIFRAKNFSGSVSVSTFKFLAIILLFISFVYLYIPRVDFFLASLLFLFVFINMFYLDDTLIFRKMFFSFIAVSLATVVFFWSGLNHFLENYISYPADWLTAIFLVVLFQYVRRLSSVSPELKKRFKQGSIVAFTAPFILGPIFKFFLLVPLPFEGVITEFMDKIWYWDF